MSMKMDGFIYDRESLTTSYRIAANPGFLPGFLRRPATAPYYRLKN
jgi:hypothetical protein